MNQLVSTAGGDQLAGIGYLTPELILVAAASLLIVLDLVVERKRIVAFAGVLGCLAALIAAAWLFTSGDSATVLNGMFVFDGFGGFFKLFFYLTCILTIGMSVRYLEVEGVTFGEYYAVLLLATAGMAFMVSAADLIVLFLGLELTTLSTYILIGIKRESHRSNEAAIKYFLLGGFSTAFLLYGISLTFGMTGTTNIQEISGLVTALSITDNPIMYLAVVFLIVAFGFKVALVPFHMWAPDVYEGAPTSITAFMSVGPKAAGFAVLGRVLFYAFGEMHVMWTSILVPLSILTMAVGSILALAQSNIKRMLAYSSIAHAGYILLGIIPGTIDGLTSSVNYLMIYMFMNMGAFAIVIMLRSEGFKGEDLEDYKGLAKTNPAAAALMLVFMFSLTGIPPTAGFIGKFYVIMEAINAGHTYLAITAVIFSVISAFFYLRVVMYMYMNDPKETVILTKSPSMTFALALTSVMVLVLGVFPSVLLDLVRFSILS